MAVPSLSSLSRQELRADGLKRRRDHARSLTPDLRAQLEQRLAERVLPHLLHARVIAAYHPLRDEISPDPIIERLADGQVAVLPWFGGRDERMIWRQAPATEASPWGVLQPPASAPALAPDLVIVPFVLADRAGTRIGHGKGHYDRALAHLREARPVATIGIGWDAQLSETMIPAEAWDVPLDAIATPGEWIDCR